MNRRKLLQLLPATCLGASLPLHASDDGLASDADAAGHPVWSTFERTFTAAVAGNPFLEVTLTAELWLGSRVVSVDGFFDGYSEGSARFRIRFMPDTAGEWSYKTSSNVAALNQLSGSFQVMAAAPGLRGPVGVHNGTHFAYADGTPFFPFGTTCYAWVHQSEELQQQTLASLKQSPFNKIRMCVFPKSYQYNHNEPALYPFARDAAGKSDFNRLNPAFFQHLESRIRDLQSIGVEADLILFHPYDRWGYATMPKEADDRYLRYVLARLSSFPNVWWSLANEFDLMKAKSAQDFDRFFHIVQQYDPYGHLRSVHYSHTMYDYSHPWVTHASLQTTDFAAARGFVSSWRKPVCFDEVMYEGNLNSRWGNLSADEMARRFWLCAIAGCYATHGETYLDPAAASYDEAGTPTIWWSHGGKLHGDSPRQIQFLRTLLEESAIGGSTAHSGLSAPEDPYYLNATALGPDGRTVQTVLYFFDFHRPIFYDFPLPAGVFTAELIDPQACTLSAVSGTHTGKARLKLSGKPFQAVRFLLQG